jgi:hypothetical protein
MEALCPTQSLINTYQTAWCHNRKDESEVFVIPYFSIDNMHLMYNACPNVFIAPFDVQITRISQLAVELGSTDRGRRNSLKARAFVVVTVVILSLMNFLDLNSLMFNKY